MSALLTTQEKSHLVHLFLWEKGRGVACSVSKKFFGEIVGREFTSSNMKQLKRLVDKGYLDCIVGGNNMKFFQLTPKGRMKVEHFIENAEKYQWAMYQEGLWGNE